MDKALACCFTGHRKLPKEMVEYIIIRLNREVENLIAQGVTDFISGGALGFDQIAASLIVAKKEIRLIFALPCKDQNEFWNVEQTKLYHNLLEKADEIVFASEEYHDGCMKERNRYMVDRSSYCICARLYPYNRIDQIIKYSREKGVKVINVADQEEGFLEAFSLKELHL